MTRSDKRKDSGFDALVEKIKRQPKVALLLLIGTTIIATASLTASLDQLIGFGKRIGEGFRDSKVQRTPFYTILETVEGISIGDPVHLFGMRIGKVTEILLMPPQSPAGKVFVGFTIEGPYFAYVWVDSKVKVTKLAADKSVISVLEGSKGPASYQIDLKTGKLSKVWDSRANAYTEISKHFRGFYVPVDSQQ